MTQTTASFAIDAPDALLALLGQGDRTAFQRPVFTLALRMCGDREQAAKVLRETIAASLSTLALLPMLWPDGRDAADTATPSLGEGEGDATIRAMEMLYTAWRSWKP